MRKICLIMKQITCERDFISPCMYARIPACMHAQYMCFHEYQRHCKAFPYKELSNSAMLTSGDKLFHKAASQYPKSDAVYKY